MPSKTSSTDHSHVTDPTVEQKQNHFWKRGRRGATPLIVGRSASPHSEWGSCCQSGTAPSPTCASAR